MNKKRDRSKSKKSKAPEDRLRERIVDSDFSVSSLADATSELERDFEADDEAYWLEGAMEVVAHVLSELIDPVERSQYSSSDLSEILEYISDEYGLGEDAAAAASEVWSAQSTLNYEDLGIDELEAARDTLVDELHELAKSLARFENE